VLAHKSRALEAGAELVIDIDAGDGRGQGYSCRDFEGHIWSFGTFDPWRGARAEAPRPAGASPAKLAGLVCAAVVVTALATTALLSWLSPERSLAASLAEIEDVLEKPVDLAGAERLLQQARTDLARERALRMRAERASAEVTGRRSQPPRLAQRSIAEREAEADMVAADRPVREARVSLDARREVVMFPTAKPAAAKPCPMEVGSLPVRVASSAAAGRDELDALRRAVALAQAQLKEEHDQARSGSASLRNQLERERSARESAERAAREARLRVARIEALRRAEHEKRNAFGGYRDISGEIFPASR
ncbi:MAG: hypothetical protein NW223_24825, partial [Hyphomicrobiaceae bacterium]|nr:hypothetical protein [Hyphomicrobiaceae bacterium]